jgi:hypothetical protein
LPWVDIQIIMEIAQNHTHRKLLAFAITTACITIFACGGCQSNGRNIPSVALGELPGPTAFRTGYRLGAGDGLGKSVFDWFASNVQTAPSK